MNYKLECKYLLPCGYCDKNERICHIRVKDTLDSCTEENNKCDHNYVPLVQTYETNPVDNTKTTVFYYKCSKCGALDFRYEVDL